MGLASLLSLSRKSFCASLLVLKGVTRIYCMDAMSYWRVYCMDAIKLRCFDDMLTKIRRKITMCVRTCKFTYAEVKNFLLAVFITWRDWLNGLFQPITTLQQYIANELVDKACFLSNKYPNLTLKSTLSAQFLEYLCSQKDPTPPFNAPPFTGGNCPTFYNVSGFYTEANNERACGSIGQFITTDPGVLGPIVGINQINGQLEGQNGTFRPLLVAQNLDQCPNPNSAISVSPSTCETTTPICTPLAQITERYITKVSTVDGSPDNCGDALAPPPDPPTVFNDFNLFLDYDYTDQGGADHTFQLFGDVTVNPSLEIPFEFNFSNQVFTLDLGGINVNLPSSGGGGGGGNAPAPGSETPPPADNPELDEEVKPDSPSQEETDVERLAWVTLQITASPQNIKSQSGGGGAPNVFYYGWLEFRSGNNYFPRQPVHFANNIFEAPQGADGYAYTLYEGVSGIARVYTVSAN